MLLICEGRNFCKKEVCNLKNPIDEKHTLYRQCSFMKIPNYIYTKNSIYGTNILLKPYIHGETHLCKTRKELKEERKNSDKYEKRYTTISDWKLHSPHFEEE